MFLNITSYQFSKPLIDLISRGTRMVKVKVKVPQKLLFFFNVDYAWKVALKNFDSLKKHPDFLTGIFLAPF